MRSSELARLAGVTVRTLRHYHQVGVLEEPERGLNGYRDYDVRDLVRLLRIKRLASLGIPLDRMPALLDDSADSTDVDPAGGADALLEELDRELAEQIDRLSGQRAVIAQLRGHRVSPDVPPELAPFFAVFAATGLTRELLTIDRDQSVLLAHFAGAEGMAQLTHFYERLSAPDLVGEVAAVTARFARLGPGTSEQEMASLVEDFAQTFQGVIAELGELDPPLDLSSSAVLVEDYAAEALNPQQRQAMALLVARFDPPDA
ncbi:MerR family transcriptional regulator [Oerskovia flava]|uniref:MerR family transcriptional regulator n=1 Tax=Oerskovia flava TaxID=2986422 RepID=UPI00223F9658|nr:MerR family transcriptional regulator [Oerskovia sp. JB1-3-2]